MKKFVALAASASLALSFNMAMPQAAHAAGNDEAELCKTLVDQQIFESVGECVGLFRSAPAKLCQNYDTDLFLQFFNFKSRGDCVSFFRSVN